MTIGGWCMLSGRENVNVAGARHGLRVCLANMCTAGCETGSARRLFAKLCTFSGGKRKGGLKSRLNGMSMSGSGLSVVAPSGTWMR